jgi:hypothetical protein
LASESIGGEARSGAERLDTSSVKLLAEAASFESTNVLELAKLFCMNKLPVGDFVGGGGGGGVEVDVLGLVTV